MRAYNFETFLAFLWSLKLKSLHRLEWLGHHTPGLLPLSLGCRQRPTVFIFAVAFMIWDILSLQHVIYVWRDDYGDGNMKAAARRLPVTISTRMSLKGGQ
jgi:hypothetical protein